MYPPIEPNRHGMLDVGHENLLYWEECGNPEGKPALVLHGGPGSGATPGWRRYFDLAPMFPQAWERFHAGASGSTEPDLPTAYYELLNSADAEVRDRAARDWCAWEDALVPTTGASARYRDPWFRAGFARLVTH